MSEVTKHDPGTFCWTDLGTTDAAAAKKFYQGIFGCQSKDTPMGPGAFYSMLTIDNKDTCAIYPMMDEQKKAKVPPNWQVYIAVKNVEETLAKAQSAGAKVVAPVMDVMEHGRMAVLSDPTGAVFAIWEAKDHIGATVEELPGTVCWRELMTPNLDTAAKFYSTVFGWKASVSTMAGFNYHQFTHGEDMVGGMMIPPMKDIPPHWLTYWVVANCDQVVAQAKKLGGEIIKPGADIPEIGRFAILRDPQGAAFAIMQPES